MSLSLKQGTPHTFDKYEISKVGTGEGTQWFGWGLYFTDNDGIAQYYAKTIGNSKNEEIKIKYYVFFKGVKIGEDYHNRFGQNLFSIGNTGKFTELIYPEENFKVDNVSDMQVFNFVDGFLRNLATYCGVKNNNKESEWITTYF
jgi:hypothetical protein